MDDFSRLFCVEAALPCKAELRSRRDCYRVVRVLLIACQDGHTQYDVTDVAEPHVSCRCDSAQVESSDPHCESCGSQIVRDNGSRRRCALRRFLNDEHEDVRLSGFWRDEF
jgi:hypothetical protein